MSQSYSEYSCKNVWDHYKLIKKTGSEEEYCIFWKNFISEVCDVAESRNMTKAEFLDELSAWNFGLKAVFLNKYRRVNHYFLDKSVAEFCILSVKTIQDDYCKPLPCLTNTGKCMVTEDEDVWAGFFVHFPSCENIRSLYIEPNSYTMNDYDKIGKLYANCTDGDTVFGFNPSLWESQYIQDVLKKDHIGHLHPPTLAKFVMGLSLYIDAFPDVVREADNIKHVGHYKGHRHSVRANDIVRTEATHSVSPHFRRGHFRLLQSEKFKAKRGQAIFIKGCFVKGHAFDVLADDGKSVGGVA